MRMHTRASALVLLVAGLLVMALASPVGADLPGRVDADFWFNDYPDDPEEPDQHLVVMIDEGTAESYFRWESGADPDAYWMTADIGCVGFIGKAAVVSYEVSDLSQGMRDFGLSWWIGQWGVIELIDGGPGIGDDSAPAMFPVDEAAAFEYCASGEHIDSWWESEMRDGNIYVAATGPAQVETLNERWQIPRDTELVPDPGMLNFGCSAGLYVLEDGFLHFMMQSKDQGDTVRLRQQADMDGVLRLWEEVQVEVCEDEECTETHFEMEWQPTDELFDLNQEKARADLVVDQYTGAPIEGSVYFEFEMVDASGAVADWGLMEGIFDNGVFHGTQAGTCGF